MYYRLLGPERTITGAYNAWRFDRWRPGGKDATGKRKLATTPAHSWSASAKTWRWQERAEAWDAHQRRVRLREEERLRQEWRKKRRQLLEAFCERMEQAVQGFEPAGETLPQLTQAVEKMVGMLRAEWEDLAEEVRADPCPGAGHTPIRLVEVVKDYGDPGAPSEG
jgi:hypothetical protein